MTIEDKKKILEVLQEKRIDPICPICKKMQFTIVDGYITDNVSDDYKKQVLGGRVIPSFVLVCNNCGFMSHHALGALGLINNEKNTEK